MMMRKTENGEVLTGNDRFEGYCKDMMDLIAGRLGIRCKTTFISSFSMSLSGSNEYQSSDHLSYSFRVFVFVSYSFTVACYR